MTAPTDVSRTPWTPPPADLAERIDIYLADPPNDGSHLDAAGATAFELLDEARDELRSLAARPVAETGGAADATYNVGRWLSAALDDPQVCAEMKADILAWMEAGKPNIQPGDAVEATWSGGHTLNEWADLACNAMQWFRNIKDGISTADEALAETKSNYERIIPHSRANDTRLPGPSPSPGSPASREAIEQEIKSGVSLRKFTFEKLTGNVDIEIQVTTACLDRIAALAAQPAHAGEEEEEKYEEELAAWRRNPTHVIKCPSCGALGGLHRSGCEVDGRKAPELANHRGED